MALDPLNTSVSPGVMSTNENDAERSSAQESEEQPLLRSDPVPATWSPPPGFLLIQIAIMANVFLGGFDGTITASTYAVISSEFNAANTASWLTTSYLITSTAFQPLYGRFSDILGRRSCFFTATITFMIGCLGCAVARDVIFLNIMRALTGIGGGGLMTMATIINSDLIPFRQRGMYQAIQNVSYGFGAICGASFGGAIVDSIGWRWCFLLQVPISLFALIMGYIVLKFPSRNTEPSSDGRKQGIWQQIDVLGACLLILALSAQLVGLSLGGNILPWTHMWVILPLLSSVVLLVAFVAVEANTTAAPLIPLKMLRGQLAVSTQISNVCVGMAAYAPIQYLFTLPLMFQVILLDSPSKAGTRLVIPCLFTPLGGLVAGIIMSRWGKLASIVRVGAALMFVGNLLVMLLRFNDSGWKYFVYVIPANLGQGMVYPGILFTFLAAFDHTDHAVSASTVYLIRSLGTVWGVAITSTIMQNTLNSGLGEALSGIPDKWKVIDEIRHSISAIYDLPPDVQMAARLVYYRGIRLSFMASAIFAFIATVAAIFTRGKGLERAGGDRRGVYGDINPCLAQTRWIEARSSNPRGSNKMPTDTFHLYSYFCSSCCQRIIIAAHLKGISLEYTYIDLGTKAHTTDEYKESNPSASVPTLVVTSADGEKTIIRQSMTILDYFEERFPDISPLLPRELRNRAQVRDLVNIIAIDTQPTTNARIVHRVKDIRGSDDDLDKFAKQAFTDGFQAYESLLVKQGGEGRYSFGDTVSMADVVLVPTVDQALLYSMDLDFVPNLKRIHSALKELEAFKAADWRNQGDTPEKFRAKDI
ncbi:Major facilitator superfamily domain, general substrate transporter [Penicillium expansum]|uniref:Major facilitator superfamily domain, general substrate transporter n=1 Tax=Penicillium expansum TaxID=27334 RepID=A0A0A2JSD2_PENEN|nr:Major facilitator superfamily domain, general substrate transporter [Penicillium expansum]KGO58347.1 Major facilitator superfamily domain, general substrate transporter [Penicillium expansum]